MNNTSLWRRGTSGVLIVALIGAVFVYRPGEAVAAFYTDLVSCWAFDGDANDSYGTNHLLAGATTTSASPSFVGGGSAKIGQAADFEDSETDYFYILDSSAVGLDIAGDFSFSMWLNPESGPDFNDNYFPFGKFEFVTPDYGYGFNIYYNSGTTAARWAVSSNGSSLPQGQVTTGTFNNGTWYHFVGVYDASAGSIEFFKDGSSIGTASGLPTSIFNSASPFIVGNIYPGGTNTNFDGRIDEFAIWDRTISVGEVGQLYNTGNGVACGLLGEPAPTINSFTASPSTILSGESSTLAWSVTGATTLSLDEGIGIVTGTTTSVNPTATTTYTLTAVNLNGTTTQDVTIGVTPALPTKVRKSVDESITSDSVLSADSELNVGVTSGKSYLVRGMLFASSTGGTPDLKLGFDVPAGSDMRIGVFSVETAADEEIFRQDSAAGNVRYDLAANHTIQIEIDGTLEVAANGSLRLLWSQFAANAASVTVGEGSYLKVEEI